MSDLAPAPAQWTSDDVGRTSEQNLAARKKAARKAPPAVCPQEPEREPDLTPDPNSGRHLDVLA